MKKITLRQLTNTSWILLENSERKSLVIQKPSGSLELIGQYKENFSSFDQMQNKFGKFDIEAIETPVEKEQGKIFQYPVKHDTWFNELEKPVPNYTRTATSSVAYAAGYFAVKYPHGWSAVFCPKLSTLNEYEYQGPFTNKIEMQHTINNKNKNQNLFGDKL